MAFWALDAAEMLGTNLIVAIGESGITQGQLRIAVGEFNGKCAPKDGRGKGCA